LGLMVGSRGRRALLTFAVALLATQLPAHAAQAPPPRLYVSPTGSDAGRCTRSAPCATIQAAYRLATPGSVIDLLPGLYVTQMVIRDTRKQVGSTPVTITSSTPAAVRISGLVLGADAPGSHGPSDIVVDKLTFINEVVLLEGARNIVLRDLTATNFYIRGATNVRVLRGSYGSCITGGPTTLCSNSKIDHATPPDVSANITIDGVHFHDYRIVQGSGAHLECFFLRGGQNIVIRNSSFTNCEFFDIFIQEGGSKISNVRIEGNWFGPPFDGVGNRRTHAIELSGPGPWENFVIRNNSFIDSELFLGDGPTPAERGYSNFVIENNIAKSLGFCYSGITYGSNIYDENAPQCGQTDRRKIYGYEREHGRLRVDAKAAAWIRRVFSEAAKSDTLGEVVRAMRKARAPVQFRTLKGASQILSDPVYVGQRLGAPGANPAIVRRAVWRPAQRLLR
jgi:hypothetical protein